MWAVLPVGCTVQSIIHINSDLDVVVVLYHFDGDSYSTRMGSNSALTMGFKFTLKNIVSPVAHLDATITYFADFCSNPIPIYNSATLYPQASFTSLPLHGFLKPTVPLLYLSVQQGEEEVTTLTPPSLRRSFIQDRQSTGGGRAGEATSFGLAWLACSTTSDGVTYLAPQRDM